MQRIFFLLYAGCSLLIFNSGCSGNSTSVSQDTTAVESVVPLSHDEFIREVKDYRISSYSGEDLPEIFGELVFEGSEGFAIYNFQEIFNDDIKKLSYSIVLNCECDTPEIISRNRAFNDLPSWLADKGLNSTLFEGTFTITEDIQNDNSFDFLLFSSNQIDLRKVETNRLMLFDGNKKLTHSKIVSKTDYIVENTKLLGVLEELFVETSGNNEVTIYISHTEGLRQPNETKIVEFNYKLAWQWDSKQNYWKTGFVGNYKNGNKSLKIFKNKRNLLTFENGNYVMKENCQNGGADYFQLIPFKTELSDCYQWVDNYDDVSQYLLLDIFEYDNYFKFIFSTHEDLDLNVSGERRVGYDQIHYQINKIEYGSSIEVHVSSDGTESFYTDMPDHYFLQPCESY